MTVIEGKAVDQHFEVEGKAGVETQRDGTVTFDVAGDETASETAARFKRRTMRRNTAPSRQRNPPPNVSSPAKKPSRRP